MNASPRLTIVVPTYRRPELLAQCLTSLQLQTYRDFVVFVCDNASQDEVETVVKGLADGRFVHIRRSENVGMLRNVLEGFRAARTELVMELDDDDLLHADCLSELVAPFDIDPELALTFGDIDLIDSTGRSIPPTHSGAFVPLDRGLTPGPLQPFTEIAARGLVYMVAAVLRRDAIDWHAIPLEVETAYDRYLALAAARNRRRAYYVNKPLASYRIHPEADGIRQFDIQLTGVIYVLERELAVGSEADQPTLHRELARTRLLFARTLVAHGNIVRAVSAVLPMFASGATLREAARYGRGHLHSRRRRWGPQASEPQMHRMSGRTRS